MLRITYKTRKLKEECTNFSTAKKNHGDSMAVLIHQRIAELNAADSVQMLVKFRIGKCHPLVGDRKGQYAMDLVQPYRLVFKLSEEESQVVQVIKIEDYH